MIADIVRRLRLFARHPGLTGTAVLLLAVGLSAAGVGHDVFAAVVSPRVGQSDRVARIGASSPVGLPGVGGIPGGLLRELQDATTSFSRVVAVDYATGSLSDESGALTPASEVRVARATSGFFDLAGAAPVAGRVLGAEDYQGGGPGALILSHGLWQRWSGRDPSIIGRAVAVGQKDYIVVGVMPRGVRFPMADAWSALSEGELGTQADKPVSVFAQLRPGGSWDAARAEIVGLAPDLAYSALAPGSGRTRQGIDAATCERPDGGRARTAGDADRRVGREASGLGSDLTLLQGLGHDVERAIGRLFQERRERLGVESECGPESRDQARTIAGHEDRRATSAPDHEMRRREARHAAVPVVEGEHLDDPGHGEGRGLLGTEILPASPAQPRLEKREATLDERGRSRGHAVPLAECSAKPDRAQEGRVPPEERLDGQRSLGLHRLPRPTQSAERFRAGSADA